MQCTSSVVLVSRRADSFKPEVQPPLSCCCTKRCVNCSGGCSTDPSKCHYTPARLSTYCRTLDHIHSFLCRRSITVCFQVFLWTWGNLLKSGTNINVDSRGNWLEGQRSRWSHKAQFWPLERDISVGEISSQAFEDELKRLVVKGQIHCDLTKHHFAYNSHNHLAKIQCKCLQGKCRSYICTKYKGQLHCGIMFNKNTSGHHLML